MAPRTKEELISYAVMDPAMVDALARKITVRDGAEIIVRTGPNLTGVASLLKIL
ncbi:hypothetical protein M426DRAFT_10453 [Hypoxylon sp. CI-4A]|nr:hypothetical protein M426DRAFT_10453 [Hypoxylon sp. CI-4A]